MLKHYQREQIIWESSLPSSEKLLLLAINSFIDANGQCWPGQELLARMCGHSDRTVRNVCKSLEKKGVIQRSKRFSGKGVRASDLYTICFDSIKSYLPENISGSHVARSLSDKQPENLTTGNICQWKKQPVEDFSKPTGNLRQNLPENISREQSPIELSIDLSNKEMSLSEESNGDDKPKPKPKQKKSVTAADHLRSLPEESQKLFSDWWAWYRKECDRLESNAGSKASAAKVWKESCQDLEPDEFRKGCSAWAKSAEAKRSKAPHGCYFLAGKNGHADPYWLAALEAMPSGKPNFLKPDLPADEPRIIHPEELPGAPMPTNFREMIEAAKHAN